MLQQAITNLASAQEIRKQSPDVPTKLRAGVHCRFVDDPDAALVRALRAGEAVAFDVLVKRHERRLLHVAMTITKNREDAEDAVQDSFINVFKHVDSFRGNSRFLSWLTRITINQALTTMRAKPRQTKSLDEDWEHQDGVTTWEISSPRYTPEELCSQREFERLLFGLTTGMKEASRRVLELRAVEDLPEEGIAQIMGLSLSAAKTHLFRARRDLRRRMERRLLSTRTPISKKTIGTDVYRRQAELWSRSTPRLAARHSPCQ